MREPDHDHLTALPSAPLRSLLFQFRSIELVMQSADTISAVQTAEQHTLLLFTGGRGELGITEQTSLSVHADKCCLLPPGTSYSLENRELTLYYYVLTFAAVTTGDSPAFYVAELLPGQKELIVHPFTRVIRLAEELLAHHNGRDELQHLRQQLQFQELLLLLLEQNYSTRQLPSPAQSVESTIHFMQQHYRESITVKQLAELAGVSPWQYTPIFQKLTGQRPLDYLTDVRIGHSKTYLLEAAEPLRGCPAGRILRRILLQPPLPAEDGNDSRAICPVAATPDYRHGLDRTFGGHPGASEACCLPRRDTGGCAGAGGEACRR